MDNNAGVLQGIAEQLSTQITFSNDLMARLQSLESQHGTFQRTASDRLTQLKSTQAALEASRLECTELKRKLGLSQVRPLLHKVNLLSVWGRRCKCVSAAGCSPHSLALFLSRHPPPSRPSI